MLRRMEFTRKFRHMNWGRVMFTNSKYFIYLYQPYGRQNTVWCRSTDQPTRQTVRNQQKVHVYAGISIHGITPLFFVEGTSGVQGIGTSINVARYTTLLENCLLPVITHIIDTKERHPIFQQDGALAHTATLTTSYLRSQDVTVLHPWLAQSPDLSPIENGWGILWYEMNKLRITSFDDFKI